MGRPYYKVNLISLTFHTTLLIFFAVEEVSPGAATERASGRGESPPGVAEGTP